MLKGAGEVGCAGRLLAEEPGRDKAEAGACPDLEEVSAVHVWCLPVLAVVVFGYGDPVALDQRAVRVQRTVQGLDERR